MRARPRVLALPACAIVALALAGCSAASNQTSSVLATGTTLSIYLSVPPGASGDPSLMDIVNAEQLACKQNAGEVKSYTIHCVTVADPTLSDNARAAIENKGSIAYIGELVPASSEGTVGITNALDLLQVSPTDTALELTQATPAISNTPDKYYEASSTYGATFARVVPNGSKEAAAIVAEMSSLGVTSVDVSNDGSDYGLAIADAVSSDATASHLKLLTSASGAGAIFYGSDSPLGAAKFFDSAAASDSSAKLFAPSALALPAFASALSSSAAGAVYVSEPGLSAKELPAGAQTDFVSPFEAAYHHTPSAEAVFGYEAVAAVLDALVKAGASANDRAVVVKDFRQDFTYDSPVLGKYTITKGDTSLGSFVFERVSGGALKPASSSP